ncbi:MAG: carboxypeptidase regulatory-like domain-containing protein [Acidobacteria bacterium]|nr:carboxypeptidase regulatory-like domain-containing protein [Acidobacteriota bacterium]
MTMNLRTKRTLGSGLGLIVVLTILFLPGLPWSARCRHTFKKLKMKSEMKVAAWQGETPTLISLAGRVIMNHSRKQPAEGAEIEALDSISGWASLTDTSGDFVLRDVLWYPKASYTLVIKINDYEARRIDVFASEQYPDNGILSIGELEIDKSCTLNLKLTPGMNSVTYIKPDRENASYYRNLFAKLTKEETTDEGKLTALNRYVASKFTADQTARGYVSPRQVLENGSNSEWALALALVTLAEAGNYQARMLDLIDAASPPYVHMVTEVYYNESWHLYDPVTGKSFHNQARQVASYKNFRLDAEAIKNLCASTQELNPQLIKLYRSGFYHYY